MKTGREEGNGSEMVVGVVNNSERGGFVAPNDDEHSSSRRPRLTKRTPLRRGSSASDVPERPPLAPAVRRARARGGASSQSVDRCVSPSHDPAARAASRGRAHQGMPRHGLARARASSSVSSVN